MKTYIIEKKTQGLHWMILFIELFAYVKRFSFFSLSSGRSDPIYENCPL